MSELSASKPNLADFCCGPTTKKPPHGANAPTVECLASIVNLPGVVVYQRVVTADEKIHYTYISDGCRELFGASAETILSNPDALLERHSAEYKTKFRERLVAASRSLTTWDVEASIVASDGPTKYTHANAPPERQADGSVLWTGKI